MQAQRTDPETGFADRVIHAVLVLNVPTPYRVPALKLLAAHPSIKLDVVYFAAPHVDATLDEAAHGFAPHTLKGAYKIYDRRFMHADLGIVKHLRKLRPDVVITTGYIPSYLFAFVWAWAARVPHVAMTDGTFDSERSFGWKQKLLRRIVLARSRAFIGACDGSLELFRSYGVDERLLFKAPLATDNARFGAVSRPGERVDFMYCGRLVAHKRPDFALDVAAAVATRLGRRVSIDFLGAGPDEAALKERAHAVSGTVDARFLGYATQQDLPHRYAAARVFLFPSEWDPWGVVSNEACAVGLPVIVSPHAGSANELIRDGDNGYVRPLLIDAWVDAAVQILSNEALELRMGQAGRARVQAFSFAAAADGMAAGIQAAASGSARSAPLSKAA